MKKSASEILKEKSEFSKLKTAENKYVYLQTLKSSIKRTIIRSNNPKHVKKVCAIIDILNDWELQEDLNSKNNILIREIKDILQNCVSKKNNKGD